MSCLSSTPIIDAPLGGYRAAASPATSSSEDPRDALRNSLWKKYAAELRTSFAIPGAEWIRSQTQLLRDAVVTSGMRVSAPPEYSATALPVRCSWDSSPEGIAMANYCAMVLWAGTDVIPSRPVAPVVRVPTEAEMAHARHMEDCRKRDILVTRHGMTPSDAEAVLAHLTWERLRCSFRKDTLAAVRAINEFARANGIRVSDAEQVLQEVAGPRPPPARETPL